MFSLEGPPQKCFPGPRCSSRRAWFKSVDR